MAPLLAGSLAQRDFEISGQRGRLSRAGRSVRAPDHLHPSVFVEQLACCSATPSTPVVLRRHSASQPAAGPTAAVFCFHPPTHPSAHQRLPLVMSSFVLLCSARTHSLSATPLCCCGTWSRPSAARHPLQLFLSVSCSSSFWYASNRPGLCLSSSPASASSRTPTLVLFGSGHQWIVCSAHEFFCIMVYRSIQDWTKVPRPLR